MAHSSHDYTKEDDFMLWQLHEIRHALAKQKRSPEQINRHAQEILAQYNLTHLTIVRNVEHVVRGHSEHEKRETRHVQV